jgi:hypothetical protein
MTREERIAQAEKEAEALWEQEKEAFESAYRNIVVIEK